MARKRFTEREVLQTLINQGVTLHCPWCGGAMLDVKNVTREHLHQLAMDGPDTVENCQYWHTDPCSKAKTFGSKATSYGSDAHARAKVRRIAKKAARPSRKADPKHQDRLARARVYRKQKREYAKKWKESRP